MCFYCGYNNELKVRIGCGMPTCFCSCCGTMQPCTPIFCGTRPLRVRVTVEMSTSRCCCSPVGGSLTAVAFIALHNSYWVCMCIEYYAFVATLVFFLKWMEYFIPKYLYLCVRQRVCIMELLIQVASKSIKFDFVWHEYPIK